MLSKWLRRRVFHLNYYCIVLICLSPSDPSNYNPSFFNNNVYEYLRCGLERLLNFYSAQNLCNPTLLARRVRNSLGSSPYKPFPVLSQPSFGRATTRGAARLTRLCKWRGSLTHQGQWRDSLTRQGKRLGKAWTLF